MSGGMFSSAYRIRAKFVSARWTLISAWTIASLATIQQLLRHRGPATVVRRIVAVIVNAIDGMLTGWTWTEVIVKVQKAVSPPVAHRNTAAAVIAKGGRFRVVATLKHATPARIFWCLRQAMRDLECASRLTVQTSTRSRLTAPQASLRFHTQTPAIAATVPMPFCMMRMSRERQSNQSAEAVTGNIQGLTAVSSHWCHSTVFHRQTLESA